MMDHLRSHDIHAWRRNYLADLRARHQGVIWAGGAPTDRQLALPGFDLPGVSSATSFVGWYNGHPDFADLDVDPERVRAVARSLARTERAAVYGRVGTSLGRTGTLTTALLDMVNLVAGNLDVPGGSMFGDLGIPGQRLGVTALQRLSSFRWAGRRSRVGVDVRRWRRRGHD